MSQKKVIYISTKRGDQGQSQLANGKKLSKKHLIFEVLGTLDELNVTLGASLAQIRVEAKLKQWQDDQVTLTEIITEIQKDLFVIGGIIGGVRKLKFSSKRLKRIEQQSRHLQKKYLQNKLRSFFLPGGSLPASYLDISRVAFRKF